MNELTELKKILRQKADPQRAEVYKRFFKTGRGEYGEGDIFLGVTVPVLRQVSKEFRTMPLNEVIKLLRGKIHEERFTALVLLVHQYQTQPENQKKIFDIYLDHTTCINNWDLVDASAPSIVGMVIGWRWTAAGAGERVNVCMLATLFFIRQGDTGAALKLADMLVSDRHDLMHKAVGWMLREAAKKDPGATMDFLKKHASSMPRTMLRYAIEKFPEKERLDYLKKKDQTPSGH